MPETTAWSATDEPADGGVMLPGGRTSGACQVDETVRKPQAPSTPAVHALLGHLASAGFEGAPRPLGMDAQGRQVLTLLPGDTLGERVPWPAWMWSETLLADVGSWLRRLHDHTATYTPPDGAVWLTGRPWRLGLIVGHQDAAPWNVVVDQGRLVGFVDWDTAGPSSRESDLAFTALTWVPLFTPAFSTTLGAPGPGERARRLRLLLDAYDYAGDRARFPARIAERARIQAAAMHRLAATGDPVYVAMEAMAAEFDRVAATVDSSGSIELSAS